MSKKEPPRSCGQPLGLEGHDGVSTIGMFEGRSPMHTVIIGIDLAKSVFAICELESAGRVARRHELGRDAFALWLAQRPAGTTVAMEACRSDHLWARAASISACSRGSWPRSLSHRSARARQPRTTATTPKPSPRLPDRATCASSRSSRSTSRRDSANTACAGQSDRPDQGQWSFTEFTTVTGLTFWLLH